jgi:calcium-dependent protein kinase
MFVSDEPSPLVKIIDFGLSQKYAGEEHHLHDAVGTIYTMAPELLGQNYDSKADVWSIGVMAFMLLSSSMPFYGSDRRRMMKCILKGQCNFESPRWKSVSNESRKFVRTLLQVCPHQRPKALEALDLPWLQKGSNAAPIDLLDRVQASMHAFAQYRKLKQLALMVVAYKSTSEEIGILRHIFDSIDVSHDGEISKEELVAAFSKYYSYTSEELDVFFEELDVDGTGVSYMVASLLLVSPSHCLINLYYDIREFNIQNF